MTKNFDFEIDEIMLDDLPDEIFESPQKQPQREIRITTPGRIVKRTLTASRQVHEPPPKCEPKNVYPIAKYCVDYFGSIFFQRGYLYWDEGRVFNIDCKIMNDGTQILTSECFGSVRDAYRQEIVIRRENIVDAKCTCPVGIKCKHCVASYLAYMDSPLNFSDTWTMSFRIQKAEEELKKLKLDLNVL